VVLILGRKIYSKSFGGFTKSFLSVV
jgi:hypothetical protein